MAAFYLFDDGVESRAGSYQTGAAMWRPVSGEAGKSANPQGAVGCPQAPCGIFSRISWLTNALNSQFSFGKSVSTDITVGHKGTIRDHSHTGSWGCIQSQESSWINTIESAVLVPLGILYIGLIITLMK